MKKVIGILMLLMLVAGSFGFTSAMAADCAAPVSVDCTDGKGTSTTEDDEHCVLYVDIADAGLSDCIGENDAPSPPAV